MWATASRIAASLGNRIGVRPVLQPMLRRAGDLLAPDDPEAAAILHGASEGGMPSPQTEDDHRQAVAILYRSLGATQRKFVQTLHPVKGAGDQWVPCLHYPGGLAG